jgi:aspartyl-tRNA(Asn)/glutamyl-tRNA(Gln) amidotransferase subunit A
VSADVLAALDDPGARSEVAPAELVEAVYARIDRFEGQVNALVSRTEAIAAADGERVAAARRAGLPLVLDGLPIVVKDNIDAAGTVTTVGTRALARPPAERDAVALERLRRAGAILVGKAQLHELIYGATTDNAHFGPCRNPWDLDRIPGGSSGGSGAALAAGYCGGALGTDTGGSVRVPAALCGVTALRPTFGAVPTAGVFPISAMLDTVGPMARDAATVGALFAALTGGNGGAGGVGFSAPGGAAAPGGAGPSGGVGAPRGIAGVRIAVAQGFFAETVEPAVRAAVAEAVDLLRERGAIVSEIELPGAAAAGDAVTTISRAEALALHAARVRDAPETISPDVLARLRLGEQVSGVDLARALQTGRDWREELDTAFARVDVVLSPTATATAPLIAGTETTRTTAELTRLTYPWSLAGVPAISLPCGLSDGLPIGLQLAAPAWHEQHLLAIGVEFQAHTGWHRLRPPLAS